MTNPNTFNDTGAAPEAVPEGVVGGTFRLDAMSPGADQAAAMESAPTTRKGWRSTQTIALAVLLCAAGGIVYGMRQAGIGPMAAFATTKMPDYDVTKAPGSKTADHKRILKDLASTDIAGQVPASQVQKNPFLLSELLGDDGLPMPDDQAAIERARQERLRKDAETRRRQIQGEIAGMKINGIMGADATGSVGVARLNGELYHVGDEVGELLTVKAIHARSVDLEFGGEVFTVSLDETADSKGAKKKK